MRIVHIITRLIRGGADENTLLSCNAQAAAGHEVTLVFGSGSSADMIARIEPAVRAVQIDPLVREIRPILDTIATVRIAALLRELRAEVVHTHTSKAGIVGRVAAAAVGTPIVVHGVHILPFMNVGPVQKAIYLAAERLLSPVTHAFVDVSEAMRDVCLQYGIGRGRHLVVPSGMDVEKFRSARPLAAAEVARALRLTPGAGAAARIILMVGAFEARKRQRPFLNVIAPLLRRTPEAHLVFLGEGPDREAVAAHVEALDLTSQVHLLGYCDAPERWMKRADICVLASEREGLPRVAVQYALCARPTVITDLPGVRQVILPDETGFVVATGQLTPMAEHVASLLKDRELAARMAQRAAALDLSAWSNARMVAELERLYAGLAAGAPVASRLGNPEPKVA